MLIVYTVQVHISLFPLTRTHAPRSSDSTSSGGPLQHSCLQELAEEESRKGELVPAPPLHWQYLYMHESVYVRVHVCMRACVHACMRACVRARTCVLHVCCIAL